MRPTRRRVQRRWQRGVSAAVAAAAVLPLPAGATTSARSAQLVSVIVQERPAAGDGPEQAVTRLGGRVVRQIPLIHGFSARLPGTAIAALRGTRGVRSVTLDRHSPT